MGGIDGSRGYVYQGIAAVLEAISDDSWDRIYIELPTDGDKVDIALSHNGTIIKTIQVKSTDNTFTPGEIKQWIKDLANDYPCTCYELVLIGHASGSARDLINAIKKYKDGQLDKTADDALRGFDTTIFDDARVQVRTLQNDKSALLAIVRDSLAKYVEGKYLPMSFSQLDFIARAMIADQLLKSTQGENTDRLEYEKELNKRISLIEGKYDSLRIPVYIQSFSRGADAPAEGAACLSLQNYFDGRFLKSDFRWNKDILPMVEDFLCTETNPEKAYNLHFDAHSSIAFAAGRTLDSKSGISIMPVQKIKTGEHQLWNFEESKPIEYPKWKYNDVRISDDYFDTALVIGAAVDISYAVEQYLEEAKIPIGRIIYCSLDAAGSSEFKIQNGEHAWLLAQELYRYTARRSTVERRATIHVFSAAPNALMFFLGRLSRSWGKCILYEYDFEQKRNCTYLPSITFGIEE